jgi:hypothetical protein
MQTLEEDVRHIIYFVISVLVISGCATTYTNHRDTDSITEETIVYEAGTEKKPQFSLSGSNIKLEYQQELLGYIHNTITTTRENFERTDGGFWANYVDTSWHKTTSEIVNTRIEKNNRPSEKKYEIRIPEAGVQVIIVIDNTRINAISGSNGYLILDENLNIALLKAAKTVESYKKVLVEIPSLRLSGTVDISTAEFITKIILETQENILSQNKNQITSPSAYETFAKSLVTLKEKMQYTFQVNLLSSTLESTGNDILNRFLTEKEPLVSKFPEFNITGNIEYEIEGTIYHNYIISGVAFPNPMNEFTSNSPGFRPTNRDNTALWIVIKNDAIERLVSRRGDRILIEGGVYFHESSNGDGLIVKPNVRVFWYRDDTSQIPQMGSDGRRLNSINNTIASIREIYEKYNAFLK